MNQPFQNQSQFQIPPIIFGTSALGNLYEDLNFETKRNLVHQMLKHGGDKPTMDSAGKYGAGLALEVLGEILRELKVSPQHVCLSNKLAWKRVPLQSAEPTFEPGVWKNLEHDAVCDISYDGIMAAFEQGLELIGEPYGFELLSIHDPDEYLLGAKDENEKSKRFSDILEGYRALHQLKTDGHTKAIGIGTKDWRVIPPIMDEVDLDWVMLACSLTPHTHDDELIALVQKLHSKGIQVINSAVFNGGFLVGGSHYDYRPVTPQQNPELFSWRNAFLDICQRHGVNPGIACIHFGMELPGVVSTALNTTDPSKIERNAHSLKINVPMAFWDELRSTQLVNSSFPFSHLNSSTKLT